MKAHSLVIQTPEGIRFPLLLAGPMMRFLAWFVDSFCVMAFFRIIQWLIHLVGFISLDLAMGFTIMAYFILSTGYSIAFEWFWRGQTLGKKLLRLRVMDAHGLRLHFSQVAIRNFLRILDGLPVAYLAGGMACMIHPRSQRLGDVAANTLVVRNPKAEEPDSEQWLAGKYNSLRDYPHLAARLRQRVSPQEAGLVLQALLRRNDLEPEARAELFKEMADHFRKRVPFPEEAVESLGDEQYIRNTVDILFRNNSPRK